MKERGVRGMRARDGIERRYEGNSNLVEQVDFAAK